MRRTIFVLLAGLAAHCVPPPPPPPAVEAPRRDSPPAANAEAPVGVRDYAAYEAMDSPEIVAWVKVKDTAARSLLAELPSRPRFEAGLRKHIETPTVSVPAKTATHYFYTRRLPGKDRPVLVRARQMGKNEEVVLDPNAWSADGTQSLYAWRIAHGERLLAYGVTKAGSDWRTWRFLDLRTLEPLADELRGVKWSAPTWAPGDVGLFYSGYADRSHSESASGKNNRVYYHALGTSQEDDVEVFVPPDAEWVADPVVHDAQDFLQLSIYKSSDGRNRIEVYPLMPDWAKDPKAITARAAKVLSPDFGYRQWDAGADRGVLYLFSEEGAPTGKIVRHRIADGSVETIVPARAHPLVSVRSTGPYLFAKYLEDVKSYVVVFDKNGKEVDTIRMPYPSNLFGFSGKAKQREALFGAEGYAQPYSIYRYGLDDKRTERLWTYEIDFDESAFESKQVFFESKDGTKVPMFLVHGKSVPLDGQNPTLLVGYGCYGYLLPIHFASTRVPWLEGGGVIAVANIRGGGAYGEKWHLAGKRENKQNSVDDFIAAAEWLHESGYASPEHLSILGASCGGLLVGAALTQRPELFAAAIPEVGVHDLLRFHTFSGGHLWKDEFGDPDVPADRAYLSKLSPVLAAQSRRAYPATLVTTRKNDTRVAPMSSYKLAAALMDHQTGSAPILLRVDERGGHDTGDLPLEDRVAYLADLYAFAWDMARPRAAK